MKKSLILILLFCFVQIAVSQTRITGRIIDAENKSPVQFATVAAYSVEDTTLVGGAITSDDGHFSFTLTTEGHYVLRISFIGYMTLLRDVEITGKDELVEIGDIIFN